MKQKIKGWLLSKRTYVLLVAHLLIFGIAYEIALWLRFDMQIPPEAREMFWHSLPWLLGVKIVLFCWLGCFHGWWRYVSFADLAALLRVATLSTLAIAFIDHLLVWNYQIPRAVLVLDWGVTILLVGGLRSVWRLGKEHVWRPVSGNGRHRVLMIGVEKGSEALARQINNHPRLHCRVVGFLHDNRAYRGSMLSGIPFIGAPEDATALAQKYRANEILVVTNSMSGTRLSTLVKQCRQFGINVKMIPRVEQWLNGSLDLRTREVAIEDLLCRNPVRLDREAILNMVEGRRIMVTGAGGSIGSEICRQIVQQKPESLLLVERAENNLFDIERELLRFCSDFSLIAQIADIADEERMESIFQTFSPEIVFHAAAHKHVPLMEDNPGEAVKNNVLATMTLADLSDRHQVDRFVLISTDKAVNPTSVMGVTKQLAERYVHALASESQTNFVVVRFGNVLASSGSVVPVFQEQIRRGGPVTVTHPEMQRFFMTIPEASQLVLQAAAMGKRGEIFVLDMGEPVKIVDLARELIRLSGHTTEEIPITFTGVRPGEKLFEELYFDEERMLPTPHPKVRVASNRFETLDDVVAAIKQLIPLLHEPADVLRTALQRLAPEYAPPAAVTAGAETIRTETLRQTWSHGT